VSIAEEDWRLQCGFLGFDSLKTSEHCSPGFMWGHPTKYRKGDISAENKLVLSFMKLKLEISLAALAAFFSVHKATASRTFEALPDNLSARLERWVFVPARNIARKSLPPAFKRHYPGCTIIINCKEIRTETLSDPEQQHYMDSSYKSGYTI
ncbi:hypothetical protein HPB47_016073, partial [Ixodes persulcatus]